MATPTEAERLGLKGCPNCTMRRLKETVDEDGCIHHECLSCGYLMVWTPRMSKEEMKRKCGNPEYLKSLQLLLNPSQPPGSTR